MVVILSAFAKIHYKLTLSLYCTPVTCFLRENVGGSEKNRLITGADVRTGDILPSRMRVAVLSTGLVNGFVDDALRDAGPCVNEVLLQVDCVTDRRLVQTLMHQAPNGVINCSSN